MASQKTNPGGPQHIRIDEGAGGGISQGTPFSGNQVPVNAPVPAAVPQSAQQAPAGGNPGSKK